MGTALGLRSSLFDSGFQEKVIQWPVVLTFIKYSRDLQHSFSNLALTPLRSPLLPLTDFPITSIFAVFPKAPLHGTPLSLIHFIY